MYENLKIKTDNFCYYDGIYYYVDLALGALIAKSSGGNVLFSYPMYFNMPSDPLKLDFDGTHFFSLHKEQNRILVRKWRLQNYILKLIYTYDYSSIGLLSSESTVFSKYFHRPLEYGGWVEGDIYTGGDYDIQGNELVVSHFTWDIVPHWRGPYINKSISSTDDFNFKLKFRTIDSSHVLYTKIFIYFKQNDTDVVTLHINLNNCSLVSDNTTIYSGNPQVQDNTYNTIELRRFSGGQFVLTLNSVEIFKGTGTTSTFNNLTVATLKYAQYVDVGDFRINYFSLYAYENNHIIDSDTLVIDNYDTNLTEDLPEGSLSLTLDGNTDYISDGTVLYLGGSNSNTFEEVTVTGTLATNTFGLNFYTQYAHLQTELVSFSKNLYMFNKYRRGVSGGSVYKFDCNTGFLEETFDDDTFYETEAACFFQFRDKFLIGYVNLTSFVLLNIQDLSVYDVMNINNVNPAGTVTIQVHDVEVHSGSLYRLQKSSTYYDTLYTWTSYNYQTTPIRSFIDSTTIEAKPLIMNADGISVVDITTLVKDQYAEEMVSSYVKFYDDDDVGYMTIRDTYTGITGKAVSFYKSGIVPREVLISTEVIQGDL